MAGLFKGMTGQQALQTGSDFLKMGVGTALEKQRMEQEKKRIEFEQKFKKETFKLERKKMDLFESEMNMKNAIQKAELEGITKGKPFTLGPGQKRYGPKGGLIAAAPFKPESTKPPQPFTLGPEQQRYTGEGKLLATGLPKPEKPNYARYKSSKGGLMDMETKQWIVEPPKEGEPVTFEHLTKAMEALDKLGMKDVYWEGFLRWGKLKREWLQNFIAGKEVSPELAASIKQKFPDISLNLKLGKKETDLPYKDEDLTGGFEIYKKLVPNATWDEYIKSLK